MAQVDFSNAVLDYSDEANAYAMQESNYLFLDYPNISYGGIFNYNVSQYKIVTNDNVSIILNTPSKVSILYTGSFIANGTFFYIGSCRYFDGGWRKTLPWKVSNISYSAGDTYSFVIDIEVSGNT